MSKGNVGYSKWFFDDFEVNLNVSFPLDKSSVTFGTVSKSHTAKHKKGILCSDIHCVNHCQCGSEIVEVLIIPSVILKLFLKLHFPVIVITDYFFFCIV